MKTATIIFVTFLLELHLSLHQLGVNGEECGTRFTDFSSSVVLAEVVLQGSVKVFNSKSSPVNPRTANISATNVFKGMDILKSNGRMDDQQVVQVESFGQENKEDCVASDDETMQGKEMIFFLRQSSPGGMMELSALPIQPEGNEQRRVKRSLCDTCIQPPSIRRLVCKDCAKSPIIKTLKSRKVKLGRKARLRCVARGKPKPTIAWFKNEVPILSGNAGITIRNAGLSSTLLFTRTTSVHAGQYTCVASNEVGKDEGEVTLEITRGTKNRKKDSNKKSVKDAPDRVLCQANPCLNGGTCYFSPSLDLRRCICTSGFEGVTCENILSPGSILDNDEETVIVPEKDNGEEIETSDERDNGGKIDNVQKIDGEDINSGVERDIGDEIDTGDKRETGVEIDTGDEDNRDEIFNHQPRETNDNSSDLSTESTFINATKDMTNASSSLISSEDTDIQSMNETLIESYNKTTNSTDVNRGTTTVAITENPVRTITESVTFKPLQKNEKVKVKGQPDTSYSRLSPTKTKTRPVFYPSKNGERIYPVKRKSTLKIIPCKNKNYCLNKGKCRLISKLQKEFCKCRAGFIGLRCEIRV